MWLEEQLLAFVSKENVKSNCLRQISIGSIADILESHRLIVRIKYRVYLPSNHGCHKSIHENFVEECCTHASKSAALHLYVTVSFHILNFVTKCCFLVLTVCANISGKLGC